MIRLEYIWLDGSNKLRSKVKFLNFTNERLTLKDIPQWNYDGSSTNQATTKDSEVLLRPVQLYRNCFDGGCFVLCDTWVYDVDNKLVAHSTNSRYSLEKIFEYDHLENQSLFGIEYEFFVTNNDLPLGYKDTEKQGRYYCGVGTGNAYGREFLSTAANLCLKSELNLTGTNLEVAPGQMEIQICEYGLKAADDSIILKYILARLAEINGYKIDWRAKVLDGDWNCSGCHVNFSTQKMRSENGYDYILKAIDKLKLKHSEHIDVYGEDNYLRLTGTHETSSLDTFSFGVGSRNTSIRIPKETFLNKKGYFEDRRPSSSANMYLVVGKLYKTCCL